jgi:hypothetical protein
VLTDIPGLPDKAEAPSETGPLGRECLDLSSRPSIREAGKSPRIAKGARAFRQRGIAEKGGDQRGAQERNHAVGRPQPVRFVASQKPVAGACRFLDLGARLVDRCVVIPQVLPEFGPLIPQEIVG